MKRIHCIVEGQTEVQVFSSILQPYIYEKTGVYMLFTPIKHTGGGIVKFSKILPELRNHLKDKGKIVTTYFDYYGINANHDFKYYKEAKIDNTNTKVGVELLEKGMVDSLAEHGINTQNFIPYIQLHEFEALLFSSNEGFDFQFDDQRIIEKLNEVRNRYPNPEDINDSPTTAPSKRLITILKKYNENYVKTTDGENIATIIGIEKMLEMCPRFNNWVCTLIESLNK